MLLSANLSLGIFFRSCKMQYLCPIVGHVLFDQMLQEVQSWTLSLNPVLRALQFISNVTIRLPLIYFFKFFLPLNYKWQHILHFHSNQNIKVALLHNLHRFAFANVINSSCSIYTMLKRFNNILFFQ